VLCANGHRYARKRRGEMTAQDIDDILRDPETRAKLTPDAIARLETLRAQGQGIAFEC